MRVSEYYGLTTSQAALDFVDVDTTDDIRAFVDPQALLALPSEWSAAGLSLLQGFFSSVLRAIGSSDEERGQTLMAGLREPNDTHLGLSRGRSQGHALGPESGRRLWDSLSRSAAVASGLVEDLEDTILMVEGIGPDIVSDITTNIIRAPLIAYTEEVCDYYGIPTGRCSTGYMWDGRGSRWVTEEADLPMPYGRRLLLVPKSIVRIRMAYEVDDYYRNHLVPFLQQLELSRNSGLVRALRNGRRRVTKRSIEEKYGRGKPTIVRETNNHPEVLERYRRSLRDRPRPPLDHAAIAVATGTDDEPNWDSLLTSVTSVPSGRDAADEYEAAVERLLTAVFYPFLTDPRRQYKIHEGRKRIDITYTNAATRGFFNWLGQHYPAPQVFVECKNYTREVANPEIDQLAGRFSPSRGKFGLLVHRRTDDVELLWRRCIDTARDDRGFMIPIDDEGLQIIVDERRDGPGERFPSLRADFQRLID